MDLKPASPRERILEATLQLLNENLNPQAITVRQIAERAKVGVGLVNYHFQSKDKLFNEAVASAMGSLEDPWLQSAASLSGDSRFKLKQLLKINAKVGMENLEMARILITHILLEGEFDVPLVVLPLLRELCGEDKNEQELRMLALSLIVTIQVAFLRHKALWRYTGVNAFDEEQRDAWIESFVDLVVP